MFRNLFKKIDVFTAYRKDIGPEEKFFSNVVGYQDIKKLLLKSVVAKEPVHILLTGPPSSSKTVFLLEMQQGLHDAYFIDAVNSSKAGIIDHLFKYNTSYLLIDEIDKMKNSEQDVLLNIMETGILSETKLNGKTRQKKIKLWIFATSNKAEKISQPLRSRFMELELEEYTFNEFMEIVRRILDKKYHTNATISSKIAHEVWHSMRSRDIRDAIRIAKLAASPEDVEWLVEVQKKYGKAHL
jgi:Holliday junction DNA helicase RuvB